MQEEHLLQHAMCLGAWQLHQALLMLTGQHSARMLPPHDCQLAPSCPVNLHETPSAP